MALCTFDVFVSCAFVPLLFCMCTSGTPVVLRSCHVCHLASFDELTCPHGPPSFSLRKRLIGLFAWTVNESEISVRS